MAIKNLIFDLGGVLLDLDFNKTIKAFAALCGSSSAPLLNFQDELFTRYEIGAVKTEDFRVELQQRLRLTVSNEVFDNAWNELLVGVPKERLDFIRQLKADHHHRIFLFSNINDLHYQAFMALCQQQLGANFFAGCFDKEYYSHLLGQRKPNPDAFLTILQENNLTAQNTLFIDDLLANIIGAQKVGLKVLHYHPQLSLQDLPQIIKQFD